MHLLWLGQNYNYSKTEQFNANRKIKLLIETEGIFLNSKINPLTHVDYWKDMAGNITTIIHSIIVTQVIANDPYWLEE